MSMTITRSSPYDYQFNRQRRLVVVPQEVRMCLHCAGICVDLPRIGVACLVCKGMKWITVLDTELPAWREEIKKAREILDAMEPGITLADARKLFEAIKNPQSIAE